MHRNLQALHRLMILQLLVRCAAAGIRRGGEPVELSALEYKLLRYFVERELHPALPKGTTIGEVQLNLFSGALEIDGFELKRDGETRLRAARLVADVSTLRLLTGTVQIQRAELKNAYARVDRLADGDDGRDPGGPRPREDRPTVVVEPLVAQVCVGVDQRGGAPGTRETDLLALGCELDGLFERGIGWLNPHLIKQADLKPG